MNDQFPARVWSEQVTIPTYPVGKPDRNPMFLEKRVYQGSSGKVYPLPVIDKIFDEKSDVTYTAVFLENEYLKVMVLPQLGGRIQRATDKTNGYDFVYFNEVIKPALVGLTGPWISGGIEFNWPQHHRPTTFSPVDWQMVQKEDSASVRLSEVDQMYGTKGMMTFTLYPGRAYIEVRGQLYNRTPLPQTFLWWTNPAVPVNDDTQSIFPPDVTAVYDHGKRAVSEFPVAKGVYYKHDYAPGTDISRYKNIPVPTSYMCAHSDYDFVGNYDHGRGAGLLHVADHHISPGKKQWTWGCGDFGRAWDRNLTDENGPYIELMTGVFCDNQPDFTYLAPFEEKTFTQYFMPYKKIGAVKNATRDVAVSLELRDGTAHVAVYATSERKDVRVDLLSHRRRGFLLRETCDLSPTRVFEANVPAPCEAQELELRVEHKGRVLLTYRPPAPGEKPPIPEPAKAPKAPEDMETTEELWLTGRHLEQYRHATYLPDPYYLEALRRDPGDVRANCAYGQLLFRRGQFGEAEKYYLAAIGRLTERNPNPADGEAYLGLGLARFYRDDLAPAYDALSKASWCEPQQGEAFYYLTCIDCRNGDYAAALSHIGSALTKSARNVKARALRGLILKALSREDEAQKQFKENLEVDSFDYVSRLISGDTDAALRMMGERESSFIEAAIDCSEAGFTREALRILRLCPTKGPMVSYYMADLDVQHFSGHHREAQRRDPTCCFPNRLEDIRVLSGAINIYSGVSSSRASYYLGCLLYDKRQFDDAIFHWESSARQDPSFPTVWRNLALAYFNKRGDRAKARECLERAYSLDETDARVLLELDQLYRKLGVSVRDRLAFLDAHRDVAFQRDDLTVEYCTLLNTLGEYKRALDLIMSRKFHPWEGGEGKVTGQYVLSLRELAREAIRAGEGSTAINLLTSALTFPENLGEGKLEGNLSNDVYYYLALAHALTGDDAASGAALQRAVRGDYEPAGAMYYNDQPPEMIYYQAMAYDALGDGEKSRALCEKLIAYADAHRSDTVKIDYFAVSLPDLQLFDDDLTARSRTHCAYLSALGHLGLGDRRTARLLFTEVLSADPSHQGAAIHQRL